MVLGATGLVYCGNGWYLVVLGQKRAALVVSAFRKYMVYMVYIIKLLNIRRRKK